MSLIHVMFPRPEQSLKVFDIGVLRSQYDASGSAWGNVPGNGGDPPYGHDCEIAPGHYKLTRVEWINPAIRSEGPVQIYVDDLVQRDVTYLLQNEKAVQDGANLNIGGVSLPIGGLASNGRSGVMIHGGGSNLGAHALDPMQRLCRTFGCTRMHNADVTKLGYYLDPNVKSGRLIVFTVIGDSPAVPL